MIIKKDNLNNLMNNKYNNNNKSIKVLMKNIKLYTN